MKISPTNAESKKSDVERAREYVVRIGQHCWSGKTDMIDRVFDEIDERFPKANWTRRRVRAIWHREAAGIHFFEMCHLARVAEEVEQIEEARREHREAINKTARIAAFLECQDADFHRPQIEALLGARG